MVVANMPYSLVVQTTVDGDAAGPVGVCEVAVADAVLAGSAGGRNDVPNEVVEALPGAVRVAIRYILVLNYFHLRDNLVCKSLAMRPMKILISKD